MEWVGYLLILAYTLCNLGESLFVREYAKRHGSGGMLMNAVIALFAALFFLITDKGGFLVPGEMLPLALINCCLYAAGFYFTFVAFRIGPYGLTRLISSFSLLFTVVYGIFFLNEATTVFTYIGLAFIVGAMVLINYRGRGASAEEEGKISFKWFLYLMISVVANGFIGILTRMQQIKFDDACTNEFQFISIGGSFLLLTVLGLIIDRDKLGTVLKRGTLYGLGAGLFNGAKNFLAPVIYLYIEISTAGPIKTGLGMVAAFLVALLLYKEKYTRLQKLGVLLGVLAVILLALPKDLI